MLLWSRYCADAASRRGRMSTFSAEVLELAVA
jgi:hypothetical protein